MDLIRKLSFLIVILCILGSLYNESEESRDTNNSLSAHLTNFVETRNDEQQQQIKSLRIDYYRESCPVAEQIIRSTVRELYEFDSQIAPAIVRLVFHDCFPQGCDASVMLDNADGIVSEREAEANKSLKRLEAVDRLKLKLEEACPGIVSCADIIVLAARESIVQAGGPFYPLHTGRRDSINASLDKANELPTPGDSQSKAVNSFASRGFDARETVALLGKVHCHFIIGRLHGFNGTTQPDPSMDPGFLENLRANCESNHPPSDSISSASSSAFRSLSTEHEEPGVKMDYEGPRTGFGRLYYRSLLQRRGILTVDQQLTAGEETEIWVQAYRDFGLAMAKLSNLQVLTAPMGQFYASFDEQFNNLDWRVFGNVLFRELLKEQNNQQ